jgi:hypothetical protein
MMSRARDLADLAGSANAGTVTGESLIINGNFAVSQRGASFTAPSSSAYTLDRWRVIHSHDGAVDVSQSTTAPPNFKNSLKLDVTSADTSLASSQYYIINQKIEGQNVAHLNYGSSDAKQVTVSFWVRSNKTGTYHVELQTNGSQELARQYTIDAADTWEYKTLTWIANTDHTIAEDNTVGLHVYWWLAAGDTFDGSPMATTWANNTNRVDGQTNFLDSTSNEFYLTGCKMEVGSSATPYRHESYAENLEKCQRYYYRIVAGANYQRYMHTQSVSTTNAQGTLTLPTEMRAEPTIDTTGTAGDYAIYRNNAVSVCTVAPAVSSSGSNNQSVNIYASTSAVLTAGESGDLVANNDTSVFMGFNAEL